MANAGIKTNAGGTAGVLTIGGADTTVQWDANGLTAPNLGLGYIANMTFNASVGSSALTIALKTFATTDPSATDPVNITFRNATLTTGTYVKRVVTGALSLVVSSGSTLGCVSAQQSRIAVLAIDNAGTVELAVVNMSGGKDLTETGVITTTAEGGAGAADSATVAYSTTARTSVAYRVIGYVESTQTTAGTWAQSPTTLQIVGGQAFNSMSSFGYGQTWQDVTGSRAINGTLYYNTTGKAIQVIVSVAQTVTGSVTSVFLNVNGASIAQIGMCGSAVNGEVDIVSAIVPTGASYAVPTPTGGGGSSLTLWFELR